MQMPWLLISSLNENEALKIILSDYTEYHFDDLFKYSIVQPEKITKYEWTIICFFRHHFFRIYRWVGWPKRVQFWWIEFSQLLAILNKSLKNTREPHLGPPTPPTLDLSEEYNGKNKICFVICFFIVNVFQIVWNWKLKKKRDRFISVNFWFRFVHIWLWFTGCLIILPG
jgi:hypothetical protein